MVKLSDIKINKITKLQNVNGFIRVRIQGRKRGILLKTESSIRQLKKKIRNEKSLNQLPFSVYKSQFKKRPKAIIKRSRIKDIILITYIDHKDNLIQTRINLNTISGNELFDRLSKKKLLGRLKAKVKKIISRTVNFVKAKFNASANYLIPSGQKKLSKTFTANTKKQLDDKIKKFMDDFNKDIEDDAKYAEKIIFEEDAPRLEELEFDENVDFLNINLRFSEAPDYDNDIYDLGYDSGHKRCVYDWLSSEYELSFNQIDNILGRQISDHKNIGITLEQIKLIAKKLRVNLHVFDLFNNKIIDQKVNNRDHNKKTMVFCVINDHIYPFTENVRRSLLSGKSSSVTCEFGNIKKKDKKTMEKKNIFIKEDEFNVEKINKYSKKLEPIIENIKELSKQIKKDEKNADEIKKQIKKYYKDNAINLYITDNDSLTNIFVKLFEKNNTVYNHDAKNGYISKIFMNRKMITIIGNKDAGECKRIMKTENLYYNNEGYCNIGKVIAKKKYNIDISKLKSDYLNKFLDIKRPVRMSNKNIKLSKKAIEYDMNKCFSACAEFNSHSFIKINDLDEKTTFSKDDEKLMNDKKLRQGLYYVETDDTENFLFKYGNGWYSLVTIDEAIKMNYKFKITHKCLPHKNNYIKKDIFSNFIKKTYEKHEDQDAKNMINTFIGQLGCHKQIMITKSSKIVRSVADVKYYMEKYENCTPIVLSKKLYMLNFNTMVRNTSDCLPIYNQIIENCNVLMNRLFIKLGGKMDQIINACVDSIFYNKPLRKLRLSTRRGKYRITPYDKLKNDYVIDGEKYIVKEERIKINTSSYHHKQKDFKHHKLSSKTFMDFFKNDDIYEDDNIEDLYDLIMNNEEEELENPTLIIENKRKNKSKITYKTGSFLLCGMPGTGKSHTTCKIIKEFQSNNKKVVLTASTHKAKANEQFIKQLPNMKKQTIHAFLRIDIDSFDKTYKQCIGVDVLVIDECSMLTKQILMHLRNIKFLYPKLTIVLVGDYEQLEPVESDNIYYNIEKSSFLKWLVDYNKYELIENMRSDSKMFDLLNDVKNDKKINSKMFKEGLTPINLVYTNEKRKFLNRSISLHASKKCQHIRTRLNGYKDDCYIGVGMPIISFENRELYYNNQEFYVKSVNKYQITLKAKYEKNDITLQLSEFKKNFDLGYAFTVHRSQGMTIRNKYTIHDLDKMSKKCSYVALSRTSNINLIRVK